ncbi:MAG: LysM peptidoglycan-binding domain-containing protein, partial [Sphingobacteriales bacterium]
MKRLFTLFICFLTIQIVKADVTPGLNHYNVLPDTIVVPVALYPIAPQPVALQTTPRYFNEFNIYERRLDSIQKDVQLDYNEYVQSYIDSYSRRRDGMGVILGKAKYYFPIYEKAFRDAGIPEEIKFLSIVESELNPNAVSRVGATGPWQFMYATARLYGLNMDGFVDERRDPIQSSYAAAAYLRDAYQEFGDWLLAIASYNCGKGAVSRAIEKAGANDFWSIRPYLPAETRGYVPAFIAMAYVMNYSKHHNIVEQACNFSIRTDTVLVNKYVTLQGISKVLDVDVREMALLNPSYKRQIINGSAQAPKRLIIPQTAKENYGALYDALNGPGFVVTEPKVRLAAYTEDRPQPENKPQKEKETPYHKVRRGETLGDIADSYGVTVQDLKVWNSLRTNKTVVGKVLRLSAPDGDEAAPAPKKVKEFVTYKVKHGDHYLYTEEFLDAIDA